MHRELLLGVVLVREVQEQQSVQLLSPSVGTLGESGD